jgi:DNA-binding beta-propeller fold protein YncE
MYVVVNVSSQIEVLDVKSGKSLAQIAMKNEKGIAREPRYVEFHAGKAYVCSFDGTVAKIDTSTLKIEAFVQCGKNTRRHLCGQQQVVCDQLGRTEFP